MNNSTRYLPFITSALLMYVVLFLIYPNYQYYIDPDGTAYLTIARRYASGDYARAINGYWSPWACWLTALLMKCGLAAIPASVVVNAAAATGFLFISQSIFLRFAIIRRLQWLFCCSLAIFLCYAIFWQSFDDLWECFFLLGALRLMLAEQFTAKPLLWITMGAAGALAYFAKAYSFPFFCLSTLCCVYYLSKENKKQWLKICATAIGTMVMCSMPWLLAMHGKYGIWTTATAGSLNLSWYLVGHPYWKEGIHLLIPPVYPDSPYYWEDPYVANGATPHFWNSAHLFGMQLLRAGYNVWKLLLSMLQLSVVFPLVSLFAAAIVFVKKCRVKYSTDLHLIALAFLLFPLGYVLINFEARYLWYMLPLSMVMLGVLVQPRLTSEGYFFKSIPYLLAGTFVIYPLWGLQKMSDQGKTDYLIARELQHMGLTGSFATTAQAGPELRGMERVAYFSGLSLYSVSQPSATAEQIVAAARQMQVNYLLIYDNSSYSAELKNNIEKDGNGNILPAVYKEINGVPGGVKIITLTGK